MPHPTSPRPAPRLREPARFGPPGTSGRTEPLSSPSRLWPMRQSRFGSGNKIRARTSIAAARSRMRGQEACKRSRKCTAAHQKAHRRSSQFRKKFFRAKNPRAQQRRRIRARKRLQIQARTNSAEIAAKKLTAHGCALSRIHPPYTASMTLACHRRAQLASDASDLQGSRDMERHRPCAARATHARQHGAVASSGTSCMGLQSSVRCPAKVSARTSAIRAAVRRRAPARTHSRCPRRPRRMETRRCARRTPQHAGPAPRALAQQVPRRRPARRLRGPRPDARQGMRRGSCATKDQGSLS